MPLDQLSGFQPLLAPAPGRGGGGTFFFFKCFKHFQDHSWSPGVTDDNDNNMTIYTCI